MRGVILLPICVMSVVIAACGPDAASPFSKRSDDQKNDQAMADAKPAPAPRIMPETHLAAGQMLERQGDMPGAIAQYERVIASDPRNAAAYNRLGIAYQKLGRYQDADQIFSQGIDADPGSTALRNNLGYNYMVQRRFADAVRVFQEALSQSPDFQRARMNLAIALAHLGRLDESAIEFSRVVSADVAHYNVAMVCLQKADYANGEKSLEQALAINPDCPGARSQLEKLRAFARSGSPEPVIAPVPLAGSSDSDANTPP